MTITSTPSQISHAGDGVSTVFPIPFVFDTPADLKVIETDSSGNPVEVTIGFSIAGGAGLPGTLTRSPALPIGITLTILDDPELTQPVDYIDNDSFPAETHEGALDHVTRIAKRLHQRVDRSIRVEDGDLSDGDDLLLPIAAARQGKFLAFDAQGQPTVSVGTGGGDSALRTDLANAVAGADGARLVGYRRTESGSAARSVFAALNDMRMVTDFSTIADDGTTDNTSALITLFNAVDGFFLIPYGVKYNRQSLYAGVTNKNVTALDVSQINNKTGSFTAKRAAFMSFDTSVNDGAFTIESDHNAGIETNNYGTAGTSSATKRAQGWYIKSGVHQVGSQAGLDRLVAAWQYSQDGTNTGSLHFVIYAPWDAVAGNYEWWEQGQSIGGANVYRANGNNHYKSTGAGTTGASPPVHTTGTVSDGGVSWTWIGFYGATAYSVDQYGNIIAGGSGAYTGTLNLYGNTADPVNLGQVLVNVLASGISQKVVVKLRSTNGAGAAEAAPILEIDSNGWRFFNSGKTRELLRLTETDIRFPDTQSSIAPSATAPATASSGTINTANVGIARVQPAGNISSVVLEAGTVAGQEVTVENNSAFTITFAAAGTSNVADGATSAIPALCARKFTWSAPAARWFRCA